MKSFLQQMSDMTLDTFWRHLMQCRSEAKTNRIDPECIHQEALDDLILCTAHELDLRENEAADEEE